ncbi:MAG: hypothetical protein EKK42_15035 [Pseudonocardiaceae bacterium]|nr:MAG: hypothetical protein EKK42_15035 [Pseudonocardiaceae bacterium]
MKNFDTDFADEIDPFSQAVETIKKARTKGNEATLELARAVAEAIRRFPGHQQELARRSEISKSRFNKLCSIGKCGDLHEAKYLSLLPIGEAPLYELSKIKGLKLLLEAGQIHRELSQHQIRDIRKLHHSWMAEQTNINHFLEGSAPPAMPIYQSLLSAQPRKKTKRKLGLPPDAFAMIGIPQDEKLKQEVLDLLAQIKAKGIPVVDRRSLKDRQIKDDERVRERGIQKRVDTEIRALFKASEKEAMKRKQPLEFFNGELELDGTPEGARRVLGHLGMAGDYQRIRQIAEDAIPPKPAQHEATLPEPRDPSSLQHESVLMFLDTNQSSKDLVNIESF